MRTNLGSVYHAERTVELNDVARAIESRFDHVTWALELKGAFRIGL